MPIYEDILDRKFYLYIDDYILGYNDRVGIYNNNVSTFIQNYLNTENDHFYILAKTPFSTRGVSSVITQNLGKIFDYNIANLEIEDLPSDVTKRVKSKNFNSRFLNFLLIEVRFINTSCWSVDQKAKLIRLLIDVLFLIDWSICCNPEFLDGYEIDILIAAICEHGTINEHTLNNFIHRDIGEYILHAKKKSINYRGITPNFMPAFVGKLPNYLYDSLDNMIYVLHSIEDTKIALDRASNNLDSSTEIVDCLIDQFKTIRRNF